MVSKEKQAKGSGSAVAAFVTGVGVAATIVYVMKKRNEKPERQIDGVMHRCEDAIRALESRVHSFESV